MFSVKQKRDIADAVQKILRDTKHPELPGGEIQFSLHVDGAGRWSWADIRNNGAVDHPVAAPPTGVEGLREALERLTRYTIMPKNLTPWEPDEDGGWLLRDDVMKLLAAQPKREEGFAELNKLRELSAKASPGPWEVSGSNERGVKDAERYDTAECDLRANTAFIVASVNYVREALAASPASGEGKRK